MNGFILYVVLYPLSSFIGHNVLKVHPYCQHQCISLLLNKNDLGAKQEGNLKNNAYVCMNPTSCFMREVIIISHLSEWFDCEQDNMGGF